MPITLDPQDYVYMLTPRRDDPESWRVSIRDCRTSKVMDVTHYVLLSGYGFNLTTQKGCYNMAFSMLVSYLQAFKDMGLDKAKRLIVQNPDVLEEFYLKFLCLARPGHCFEIPAAKLSSFAKSHMILETVSPPEPEWLRETIFSMPNRLPACRNCGYQMVLVEKTITSQHFANSPTGGVLYQSELPVRYWECRNCGSKTPY